MVVTLMRVCRQGLAVLLRLRWELPPLEPLANPRVALGRADSVVRLGPTRQNFERRSPSRRPHSPEATCEEDWSWWWSWSLYEWCHWVHTGHWRPGVVRRSNQMTTTTTTTRMMVVHERPSVDENWANNATSIPHHSSLVVSSNHWWLWQTMSSGCWSIVWSDPHGRVVVSSPPTRRPLNGSKPPALQGRRDVECEGQFQVSPWRHTALHTLSSSSCVKSPPPPQLARPIKLSGVSPHSPYAVFHTNGRQVLRTESSSLVRKMPEGMWGIHHGRKRRNRIFSSRTKSIVLLRSDSNSRSYGTEKLRRSTYHK